jgi:regulator of replication initiation timing
VKQTAAATLAEDFDRLERMVDEAVALIGRLRVENRELSRRLAESERRRTDAAKRLDSLLDRIEEAT